MKKNNNSKNSNQSNSILIYSLTKVILIVSISIFIATIFVNNWTSNSPTLFSPDELVPAFSTHPDNEIKSKLTPNSSLTAPFLTTYLDNTSQKNILPEFLQVPSQPFELLFPIISVAYICLILKFIPSNNWTRLLVRGILLLLMIRYFTWRTLGTLNFDHWVTIIYSLSIYIIETVSLFSFFIYTLQSIWSTKKQRIAEANKLCKDILSGEYLPSVDVFIPTYNEPEQVVCRTAIGCLAMDYPNKTVYILDDTRREHIRELAKNLGCEYITRPDNKHAKAGNINNALPQTNGELITIMDADFVPLRSFLTRTVGFFKKDKVALVQTPQTFYNPDHHVRNLGLDHILHDDLASFFGFSQSCRDFVNAALCCGTSYVVRRTALESTGGYLTRYLAEDSPTSTKMLTLGWQIVYLGEILSTGESTRTYLDFIKQRVRWHHSNYQIFCAGDVIPIWSKLDFWQKSYFLTFYIGNFAPFFRAVFMLSPLITMLLGASPIVATPAEIIYYLVPYLWLLIGSLSWCSEHSVSFFWNEVYDTILCYPTFKCLIFAIRNPFGLAFKVTRKGVKAESKNYNFSYTYPLLLGIVLMVVALCLHLIGYRVGIWQTATSSEFGLMFFLLVYNIIVMAIAFLSGIDQPERRSMDRFPLRTTCKVIVGEHVFIGYTNNVSEGGAKITLVDSELVPIDVQSVEIEFVENHLCVESKILRKNSTDIIVEFTNITLEENRALVEMLYCDMTWWKNAKRPSGVDVFLEMMSSLFGLRSLMTKY